MTNKVRYMQMTTRKSLIWKNGTQEYLNGIQRENRWLQTGWETDKTMRGLSRHSFIIRRKEQAVAVTESRGLVPMHLGSNRSGRSDTKKQEVALSD